MKSSCFLMLIVLIAFASAAKAEESMSGTLSDGGSGTIVSRTITKTAKGEQLTFVLEDRHAVCVTDKTKLQRIVNGSKVSASFADLSVGCKVMFVRPMPKRVPEILPHELQGKRIRWQFCGMVLPGPATAVLILEKHKNQPERRQERIMLPQDCSQAKSDDHESPSDPNLHNAARGRL